MNRRKDSNGRPAKSSDPKFNSHISDRITALLKNREHSKGRRILATTLAGVVVFTTSYSLILPAISMELDAVDQVGVILPEEGLIDETDTSENAVVSEDALSEEVGNEELILEETASEPALGQNSYEGDGDLSGSLDEEGPVSEEEGQPDTQEVFGNGEIASGSADEPVLTLAASAENVNITLTYPQEIPVGSSVAFNLVDSAYYDNYYYGAKAVLEENNDGWEVSDGQFWNVMTVPGSNVEVELDYSELLGASDNDAETRYALIDWSNEEWHIYDTEQTFVELNEEGTLDRITFRTDALQNGAAVFGVLSLEESREDEIENTEAGNTEGETTTDGDIEAGNLVDEYTEDSQAIDTDATVGTTGTDTEQIDETVDANEADDSEDEQTENSTATGDVQSDNSIGSEATEGETDHNEVTAAGEESQNVEAAAGGEVQDVEAAADEDKQTEEPASGDEKTTEGASVSAQNESEDQPQTVDETETADAENKDEADVDGKDGEADAENTAEAADSENTADAENTDGTSDQEKQEEASVEHSEGDQENEGEETADTAEAEGKEEESADGKETDESSDEEHAAEDEDSETDEETLPGKKESEDTMDEKPEDAQEAKYPSQLFSSTGDVSVYVTAPVGAFPADTTMIVTPVEEEADIENISETITDSSVSRIQAVDIAFFDKEGNEIEPRVPIRVRLVADRMKSDEDAVIVHVDDNGSVEEVKDASITVAGSQAYITVKAGEETAASEDDNLEETDAENAGNEATDEADSEEGTGDINTDEGTVLIRETEEDTPTNYSSSENSDESVTGGAELQDDIPAEDIAAETASTEDDALGTNTEGGNIQEDNTWEANAQGANVQGSDYLGSNDTEENTHPGMGEDSSSDSLTAEFEADEFSIYAVVYTVDFHYEVDGKVYDFSLPGGGFASFAELVEALGIDTSTNSADPEGDNDDSLEEQADAPDGENLSETDSDEEEIADLKEDSATDDMLSEEEYADTPLTLNGIDISEDTRRFVADVESVAFSSPQLVDVSRVESDTTVGQIKDDRGLEVQYSADLTEEQIAVINNSAVSAGDWALISMQPFTSEEELTVTMKNGEMFTILVTDAQISKTVIDAKGETWEITVTYGPEAEIPDGARLEVEEILPEDERYQDYYHNSLKSAGLESGTFEGEETIDDNALAGFTSTDGYAHIFDIQIWNGEQMIEPASTVSVNFKLYDAPKGEDSKLQIIHFAKNGPELMEVENNNDAEAGEIVLSFETNEFSVYTVVDANSSLNGKSFALVSGVYHDPGATTGYNESWGTDYFTIIVNGMAVMDTVSNNQLSAMSVHVWQKGSQEYVGGDATEWFFESNGNNYRIYALKNNTKYYIRHSGYSQNGNVELTTNQSYATTFKITPNTDGTVYIQNAADNNWYLCNKGSNEWTNTYFQMDYQGNTPNESTNRYKFRLCQKSDDFDSFAAQKTSVSSLTPDDSFLIYRKFVDTDGNEELYALAHDGSFVRVYDGGDYIYWRETNVNLYWNYQFDNDGYHVYSVDPSTNQPVYINPVKSPEPGQTISNNNAGLTLLGRDNGEYGSAFEKWDQEAYDYASLHVSKNSETGELILEAGQRREGTSDEFLFAIARSMPAGTEETVLTVDSEKQGIHITMFDYGSATTEYDAGAKLHSMSTVIDGNGENNHTYVEAFHPHQATQLVRNYLLDGVPVSSVGNNAGSAMTGLFTTNGSAVTNSVTGVTDLFLKSYYDENGMFRYRSEDNYAYLAPNSQSFKVYRQAATPYTTDMSVGRSYYFHGHFMPFNDINYNNHLSRLMNQYGNAYENSEAVGELPVGDGRTYEDIYGIQGTPNYFTGMKMEARLNQPRDGVLANGDDMIFKFTGDDDMWVYIDDILVLDVGGIHEPLSGTINFHTGEVINPPGSSLYGTNGHTTLKAIFDAALNDQNVPDATKDKIRAIEWNGNTFASYTNHDFAAFYMERGAGASNLDIAFNLKTTLTDEFSVKKEISEGIDPRFANEKYKFQAFFKDDSDNDAIKPLYPGAKKKNNEDVCVKVVYKGRKDAAGNEIEVPVEVDENGCFYLRAEEEAVFKMVDESTWYCVKEIEIDPQTNQGVDINDTEMTLVEGTIADSGFKHVHDRNQLHFRNKPKTQNLLITKHITADSATGWESDNPKFEFRVYMETTKITTTVDNTTDPPTVTSVEEERLVPYAQAPYYLVKTDPTDPNDQTKWQYYSLTGAGNEPQLQNPEELGDDYPKVCGYTGRSGSISSIPPEYTVVIPELTIGTHFYIEERQDERKMPAGYSFVYEELEDNTYDIETLYSGAPGSDIIDRIFARDELTEDVQPFNPSTIGRIKNGVDAKSHFYNRKLKADISIVVEKEWEGIDSGDEALADSKITVTIGRYVLVEKAGNFQIQKNITDENGNTITDIDFVAKYYITGTDTEGNERSFGPYYVYGPGEAEMAFGTLPPGSYTVREEIVLADEAYNWTPGTTTKTLTITDGENGTPTPVVFTAMVAVKTGSLKIKSTLNANNSGVDFSGVTYTVLDASGNPAKDANGQPLEYTYSQVAGDGLTINNLKVGSYTVVENGVPEPPSGYTRTEHVPSGSDRITVSVMDGGTAEAGFVNSYGLAVVSVSYRIQKFEGGNWSENPYNNSPALNHTGSFSWTPGEQVSFVLYLNNSAWDRFLGTQNTAWKASYNGQDLTVTSETTTVNNVSVRKYTFSNFTVVSGATLEIGCNAQEDAWVSDHPFDVNPVSRGIRMAASSPRKSLSSAEATRDAGVTIYPENYGTAPTTDSNSVMKYVDDTSYNEIIELTQLNGWHNSITDRPVQETVNGVSYTYYYYIKSVTETNMPLGTTCSVKMNDTQKFLVSENNVNDALTVTNTVQQTGSLKITKEVTVNGNEVTDHTTASPADGTYTFKLTKKNDSTFAERTITLTISNGITVTSSEISDLEAGVYIISEDESENGTSLTKIDGAATTVRSKEVTVAAGATGDNAASIIFTNNIGQTEITVKKVDANKASDAADRYLDNAKFSLYDENGHVISDISSIVISNLNTGAAITLDADNKFAIPITGIKISGLPDGSYQLVEREAPAGYVITNSTTTFTVSQGTVTAWSLSGDTGSVFEIPNPPGAALPNTGGPGTRLFTIFGSILVMFAGVLLVRRRRYI